MKSNINILPIEGYGFTKPGLRTGVIVPKITPEEYRKFQEQKQGREARSSRRPHKPKFVGSNPTLATTSVRSSVR